jgi:hypothetical protein
MTNARREIVTSVCSAALLLSAAAWAQTAGQPPGKAYRDLFPPRDLAAARPLASPAPEVPSKCTIRVIPADPRVDPQIRIEPPREARYTLRVIPPPSCK